MATLSVRNVVCCVTISFCCLSFENMPMPLDFFTSFSYHCKHGVVMPVQNDGEACQRTSKQHKAAFADPGHRDLGQPQRETQAGTSGHRGQIRPVATQGPAQAKQASVRAFFPSFRAPAMARVARDASKTLLQS